MDNNVLAIVGTVGVPASYGGFETLVDNLLDSCGNHTTVYCSSKSYSKRLNEYKGAKLVYIPIDANGVQSIAYDILSMFHAIRRGAKTILVLGVSGALIFPIVKFFSHVNIIVNIDGLEWRRDKWGSFAKKFLKWSEFLAVKYADVVISDNQAIADYVKAEYGVASEVIAYGGDHALTGDVSGDNDGYALSLCRIEPENNAHLILESFRRSGGALKFIGNWDASAYGRELKSIYGKVENIELIDPIYDLKILFSYRDRCGFYVHGHSAGGTNPSLVEMMFFSKAIVAYDCAYNRYTLDGYGFYFSDVNTLVDIIKSEDVQRDRECGLNVVALANSRYRWATIKYRYNQLFDKN